MPLSRLLIIIVGFILVLGMMIWLITSISSLYTQIAWSAPPLLANLLLVLLIMLLGLGIFSVFYYLRLFQTSRQPAKKRRIKAPVDKAEAAEASLNAVRQQVSQIHDEVARQALISRSQEIASDLARGNIQVVVFGTGSAGKTSLVNALMGRVVGRVSAPMGTTEAGETYSLQLQGLEREILITDTPGILEAGGAGSQRGELARTLATDANLLLFVIDNDLFQSEYEPLRALVEIGKRSLIIFNKIDLYTEDDQHKILIKLRQRVGDLISPLDIIAVTANPQPVILDTGERFQPEPDIMPVIRRMATILRAEGEDLVADNILLQSQRLGEETRTLIDTQRRRQAEKVVERFQWIGAGAIALTPLPVIDLIATAAINAQMVVEIGKIYGCELNLERGRELAISLAKTLASLGIVKGAIQLITTALQLNVATLILGKAIQGVTAAYLTRIAGKSFIEYFRHDQDWGDGGMTEVVQRQFQLTKRDEFVKDFIKDALVRVVEPLNLTQFIESEEEQEEEEEEEEIYEELPPPSRSLSKLQRYFDDWETDKHQQDWD